MQRPLTAETLIEAPGPARRLRKRGAGWAWLALPVAGLIAVVANSQLELVLQAGLHLLRLVLWLIKLEFKVRT
jgi:hypothetical protein